MLISQRGSLYRCLTLLVWAGAAAGCGSDPTQPDPGCSTPTVAVSGLPGTMVAFQTAQLTATVQPAACAGESVSWSASAGLSVSASGTVTATHVGGPFTVTATVKGVQASQTTSITMPPVVTDTRWALAWTDDPAAADYAVQSFWAYSTGASIRSARTGPGTYAVRFPGLARSAGQREAVHVSAYGGVPRRCRVHSWANDGTDLVAQVRCHDFAGALADSYFTILVTPAGSTQGRSAFVVTPSQDGSGPLDATTTHSSSQGAITVTRTETGRYRVRFDGLGRGGVGTARETFHVTAYGDGTAWCKLNYWDEGGSDAQVFVDCYDIAGNRADARFAVLMLERGRPDRRLGYVWSHTIDTPAYNPSATYAFNSSGAVNVGAWLAAGRYDIDWTGLGRVGGVSTAETNLITAYGGDNAVYCQTRNWGTASTEFHCYAPDGTLANAQFVAIWIE